MPRKKEEGMPYYNPSKEELAAYTYCVRNNIRVSPLGTKSRDYWKIDVSLDGKNWHSSPKEYDREDIWPAYYKVCIYYYNKKT